MKKILLLAVFATAVFMFSSCKTNMRRDAKLLAHKTEQCFSIISDEGITADNKAKYYDCYAELEEMMDTFDKKYKKEKSAKRFNDLFLEEIRKSDLDDKSKEIIENVYNIADQMKENK